MTSNSQSYIHQRSNGLSYYETLEMKITESGTYTIRSSSNINLYGLIYNQTFFPYDSMFNLLAENDDEGRYEQFLFHMNFYANVSYKLVVTTRYPQIMGNFSILAFGPGKIIFTYFSKYENQYSN